MMETYEAVYEDGRLEWLETPPHPGRCRVLVTVLEELPQHSLDEVDQDIEAMRETWNRPWYEE